MRIENNNQIIPTDNIRTRQANLHKIGFVATVTLSMMAATWMMIRDPNLDALDWNIVKAGAAVAVIVLVGSNLTKCATSTL